jgi:hypothetical protein
MSRRHLTAWFDWSAGVLAVVLVLVATWSIWRAVAWEPKHDWSCACSLRLTAAHLSK